MSNRHRLPRRKRDNDATDESAEKAATPASEAVELTESTAETTTAAPAESTASAESTAFATTSESAATSESAKTSEPAETTESAGASEPAETTSPAPAEPTGGRGINWARVFAFGVLPALALLLAGAAGYLKWVDNSVRNADAARAESVQVAKDSTVAMLSYKPDTVEQQLNDARSLLTGDFEESYTGLINDVVIPGAQQKQISAVASVPAAASVSAGPDEAVVLVFVNQTVVMGQDAPTDTASSVRVTLEKIDGRWLISKFDPV